MLPPDPAPHACDPETTSSPDPNETSETLNDVDPVVSEWLRLASMDRQSPDFLPLLSSLVENGDHAPTVKLQDKDARTVLGVLVEVRCLHATERESPGNERRCPIRQVLREGKIPIKSERDTRKVMRTLAYDSGQIPLCYRVLPGTLSVEGGVVARGGSSEVREGRLGEKAVAVKILRPNKGDASKVCSSLSSYCDVLTNSMSALALR